jgi:hypothetical protein
MGIDKPDVRFVVHHDMPKNIEAYYQETGRGGRDGETSYCLLLYNRGDAARHEIHADEHEDPVVRDVALKQIAEMASFAEARDCRRKRLLAYFGERFEEPSCGACDNCRESTAPRPALARKQTGDPRGFDRTLFERLRALRKRIADARGIPAFCIFHDSVLQSICREYPQDRPALAGVKGIGPRKAEEFGPAFLHEIHDHVKANGAQDFGEQPAETGLTATQYETVKRYLNGQRVGRIAVERKLAIGAIIGHLAAAIEAGEELDTSDLLSPKARSEIAEVFRRTGEQTLKPAFELLQGRYDYPTLRLFLATRNISGEQLTANS